MNEDEVLEPDPYAALGVANDAPLATIRSTYRKLVLTCHPDKVKDETDRPAASERFHRVQQAYEILSDETRRRDWDHRAKKAALEAETAKLRQSQPKRPQPSRYATTSGTSRYGEAFYQDVRPKKTQAYDEEDYFSAKFAELRPSSKSFDPRYSGGCRTSVRVTQDQIPDFDAKYERKLQEKKLREREAAIRDEKARKRDRERKRDAEAKYHSQSVYVESESSDPDAQTRRRGQVGDTELDRKIYGAMGYIKKQGSVEPETHSRSRAASNSEPSPANDLKVSVDDGRRKSRRKPADPSTPLRRPSMPVSMSESKKSRSKDQYDVQTRSGPTRSATFNVSKEQETRHQGLRRAETMPTARRQTSNLKQSLEESSDESSDLSDSDSSRSSESISHSRRPPLSSGRRQSSRTNKVAEAEDYFSPREAPSARRENASSQPTSSQRPSLSRRSTTYSSNTQTPSRSRASSHVYEASPRPQLGRSSESTRVPPQLRTSSARGGMGMSFSEYVGGGNTSDEYVPSPRSSRAVNSPKTSRRTSEQADRDAYPGSQSRRGGSHRSEVYA